MLFLDNSRCLRGIVYFVFCLTLCLNPHSASAGNTATSIESLQWLPLLTASMERLQPDIQCPQNIVHDIQVDKKGLQINTDIAEVNWDLNCTSQEQAQATQTLTEEQKNQQVKLLLQQLTKLPSFNLRIKSINLLSDLIENVFSSALSIDKTESQFLVTLVSAPLNAALSIDLVDKTLTFSGVADLEALSAYIKITEQQKLYFNNDLIFDYQGSLINWAKGKFKIEWRGALAEYSEDVHLLASGNVDLIAEKISLTTLSLNTKRVVIPISEKQSWETSYIKFKMSEPASFNYGQFEIEKMPLHLRIGRSALLTKVERGKSKRIRIDQQKLPALFAPLSISGKPDDLLVDWSLVLLNQKLTGKLFVDSKKVRLDMADNSINLKTLIASSQSYVEALEVLTIEKGTVMASLNVEYDREDETIIFDSAIKTTEVAGANDTVLFDGLDFTSQLSYFVDKQKAVKIYQDKHVLKIENLFVGFPMQAVQIDAQVNAGQPVIQHFKARLLGGRLDFDDFKLDAPSQTILNIAGISLAEVIKYSAYPEIKSQGIIDGALPLTLKQAGPEIQDGLIFARPPGGYIKVPENTVVKAMGRGNPALSFTLQLLSNFQFDTMQGRIGYTNDGETDLKIKIEGISPKVSGTQPIIFNYSHNENVLKLLQSLRFNDNLARDIKERY